MPLGPRLLFVHPNIRFGDLSAPRGDRWLVTLGRGPLAWGGLGTLTEVFSVFPECLEVLGARCEVLGDRCDLISSWTCPEGSPGDGHDHGNVPRETE
ncbi:hypothetical protein CDL15_Pgr016510 [Punica granatum]|uniref:Uncharacterized protein n=1 Tax=Punica granatum TaxID=22663 RepID=A0A218XDZ9_PUNGR|nr:hypothetical protein CDL15_Pgr016510 [Punica granatum]